MSDHHHELFDVQATRAGPGVLVAVSGELDMANAARFDQALRLVIGASGPVELDLRGLSFCDTSGMRALLIIAQEITGAGRLLVTRAAGPLLRLIDLMSLRAAFGLVDADGPSGTGPAERA